MEYGSKRLAFVMRKQSGNIFKEQIRRSSGLSQSGNLKEQSPSGILESSSSTRERKALAGESPAEQVEVGHGFRVNGSCIGIVFLLLPGVMDGAVAGVGVLVDLAVAHAPEPTRPGESCAKAADAGKHIEISNQIIYHLLLAGRAVPFLFGPAEHRKAVHIRVQGR